MTLPELHVHPEVWGLLGAVLAGYVVALRRLGPGAVLPGEPVATRGQRVAFTAGVLVLLAGASWPIHDLAEDYLFSVHMVQHVLFSLVAPPLLLLGTPRWLATLLLRPRRVMALAVHLTRPVVALLVFNTVIVATHWPPVVDAVLRSEPLHLLAHVVLFTTALCMWVPVLSPAPALLRRLTPPGQMLYLFLQSVVPTVPASFLTFADKPIYDFYAEAPRIWDVSATTDQLVAGLLMKIGAGFLLWTIITLIFFRWYAEEDRRERGVLVWDDVERELQELERGPR
jgi:putative membrane protein